MNRVVFISSQPPRDGVAGFLAGSALLAAVVSATMAGWNSGGLLWAILYGLVMLITFPFLLTFGTIFFLAIYPLLAWPGSVIADQLGWTWFSPHALKRLWAQRISVILVLLPILWLLEWNAVGVFAVVAGIATFGVIVLGLLIALPVLLFLALFLYALSRPRSVSSTTYQWHQPDLTRLPPPE